MNYRMRHAINSEYLHNDRKKCEKKHIQFRAYSASYFLISVYLIKRNLIIDKTSIFNQFLKQIAAPNSTL